MIPNKFCTIAGLSSLVFWSTSVAVTRVLTEQFGSIAYGAIVYTTAGLLVLLIEGLRHKDIFHSFRLSKKYIVFCGLPFMLYCLCYTLACLMPPREMVPQVSLVNYLWPGFILFLSIPIQKNHARWSLLISGSAIALSGTFIATIKKGFIQAITSEWDAFLLMFFAAFMWGLYSNMAKKLSEPGQPNSVPLFQAITGLCFTALYIATPYDIAWKWSYLPHFSYAIIILLSLSYYTWEIGMKGGDQPLIGAASYAVPIASTGFACIILGEKFTPTLIIGCILVIIGALISRKGVIPHANQINDNTEKTI